MSNPTPRAEAKGDENILDLLNRFFPSSGEIGAFVGGIVLGGGILSVLVAIAFMIGGHIGIWRTF